MQDIITLSPLLAICVNNEKLDYSVIECVYNKKNQPVASIQNRLLYSVYKCSVSFKISMKYHLMDIFKG